jgi:DNA-binding SARP family transcriptional activator
VRGKGETVDAAGATVADVTPGGPARRSRRAHLRLALLGGFEMHADGGRIQLPVSAQRVAAFVALHERPLRRAYVAGSLWPDVLEERAAASLRSALWRIHRRAPLIDARGDELRLVDGVDLDLREAEATAARELEGQAAPVEVEVTLLVSDLLPGWYDDWVQLERERFRQLRLRALDALCERLTTAGHLDAALEVGMLSVAGEPLRESAHRALIGVHLADGNVGEAVRQYELCRRLLREQLGISPSDRTRELIAGCYAVETDR